MQSLRKYNKEIKYLLRANNIFSKHMWVVPLKDKRGISIVNAFQKIISEGRKPNKIWVDQGGEFYNNLFKRFLKINNIEMYSTYNEGKSVATERFIKTLKNKIFKHMAAISKNVYFDVLEDIVNKYNKTVDRSIKIKPIEVASDSYAEYNEDSKEKGSHWSEEVIVVSKISDLNGEPITGSLDEKNCKKQIKKKLEKKRYLKER